jgi:predicted ATPase
MENDGIGEELAFLWFVLRVGNEPVYFPHRSMSDGTLRAFGVLLALFQCVDRPASDPIPLVGIEEPESTVHPAAAGVLFDALHEASHFTQVVVSTHSPDLLDIPDLDVDWLRIVEMVKGKTVIGPADEASRSIVRDRLCTAGELLRQNHLKPQDQAPGPVSAESN